MTTTAYADQYQAASRDAQAELEHLGEHADAQLEIVPMTVGSWHRDQAAGVIASIEAGTADYCEHLTGSPAVAFAAAWQPGRIVCDGCMHTFQTPTRIEDFTCDRCGAYDEDLHTAVMGIGPIIFSYGLCHGCGKRPQATDPIG